MGLPRLQNRLKAHNTLALHFPGIAVGIHNNPVAAQQLNSVFTAVFNGNQVSKNKLVACRIGVIWQVACFHRNGNAVCCENFHGPKINDPV